MCQMTIQIWQHVFRFCVFRIYWSSSGLQGVDYWFSIYFKPYSAKWKKIKKHSYNFHLYHLYTSFHVTGCATLDHLIPKDSTTSVSWVCAFFPLYILWCFHICKNLSGWGETAPPWVSHFLERAKAWPEHAFDMQTHPEPYLLYLATAPRRHYSSTLIIPGPGTRQHRTGWKLRANNYFYHKNTLKQMKITTWKMYY